MSDPYGAFDAMHVNLKVFNDIPWFYCFCFFVCFGVFFIAVIID